MTVPAVTESVPVQASVRGHLCRHIDGIAVGSTVAALDRLGVLRSLAAGPAAAAAQLAVDLGVPGEGHLGVALRLLADQGWALITPLPDSGDPLVRATPAGRTVFGHAEAYRRAVGFLPCAQRLLRGLDVDVTAAGAGETSLAQARALQAERWGLPRSLCESGADGPTRAGAQMLGHLDGHVVGPALVALERAAVLRVGEREPVLPPAGRARAVARTLLEVLAQAGWAQDAGGRMVLTAAGEQAVRWSRQYWYPLSYLATFQRVGRLLGDDPRHAFGAAGDGGEEPHIDRALDLAFSGEVFSTTCERPALEILEPLFDTPACADQPHLLIDTGCGDGRLLAAAHRAVRERTARGAALDRWPLTAVAVEPSAVGRAAAHRRLAQAGIPHVIMDGDIGEPERLCEALRARGLDPGDALHLSKSVLHDRAIGHPESGTLPAGAPVLRGAYARHDGSSVSPRTVAGSLHALLERWRRVIARHGMVVVEAHAVDPAITARLGGRSLHTALDAAHGYSHQYLVEAEVFAWAARAAGLRSRAHREPAARAFGGATLTIDHFVADAA